MGLKAGDGVWVEDDPAAFTEAVVRLHQDAELWNSFSRGGLDFVKRNYSLDAGIDTVSALLKKIGVPEEKMVRRPLPLFVEGGLAGGVKYRADQADDPLEMTCDIRSKAEYDDWAASPSYKKCRERERTIAFEHGETETYHLPGYCRVCGCEVDFLVDRQCGAIEDRGIWWPNWRERMVCLRCGFNNRQRMIVFAARNHCLRRRDKMPEIYLMEKVTPVYKWFNDHLPQALCTGSEYLGRECRPVKSSRGSAMKTRNASASKTAALILSSATMCSNMWPTRFWRSGRCAGY